MRDAPGSQADITHWVRAGREEDRMSTSLEVLSRPKGRPGPKPRGRTVVPLTITITYAQRAGLEARADAEKSSISTVVRRFVAAGLAAGGLFGLFILAALIEITIAHRAGRIRRVDEP
jgi:hypothetical protein